MAVKDAVGTRSMLIGIPTEIKADENWVMITPAGVAAFRIRGHDVVIQTGAGEGSAISDTAYTRASVTLAESADDVWPQADLILKVKEPLRPEFAMMQAGQIVFTYL